MVVDLTGVDVDCGRSGMIRSLGAGDKVVGVLGVPVKGYAQALLEEPQVESEVKLTGGLPLDLGVGEYSAGTYADDTAASLVEVVSVGCARVESTLVLVATHCIYVTVDTPGCAELHECKSGCILHTLHERLVADGPSGRN